MVHEIPGSNLGQVNIFLFETTDLKSFFLNYSIYTNDKMAQGLAFSLSFKVNSKRSTN